MRSYDEYRQILELWESGNKKKRISTITGIPRVTVRDCIDRYGSLAQLEAEIAERTLAEANPKPRQRRPKRGSYNARKYNDEQLKAAIPECISMAELLRKLGLRAAGANYDIVGTRIKELGLDTSHFRGQGWLKGKNRPYPTGMERTMDDILVENSTYTSTNDLRNRLLKEGYFAHQCVSCGLTEWLGQPIPLELDHINGIRRDNRLENLRLLCPNCHAMTANYRGKNMKVKANGH